MRWMMFLFTAVLIPHLSQAQKEISIRGVIIDKTSSRPLEFATVQLMRLPDSTILQTAITDHRGRFELKAPVSTYLLRYSFIGYEIKQDSVNAGDHTDLGKLFLLPASANLSEVKVTTTSRMLTSNIDRKVYNVDQDISSKSGSATDVLRNIPSVEVDMDGNISLRGAGNVMILVDGKTSVLMGKNQAEVLQQFPANSIERIEVINNPSAKYRPDGVSGIINIVLKKNLKSGWNGMATLTAGNRDRYNGSVNFNYRVKKWNFSTSFSARQESRSRWNTENRMSFDSLGDSFSIADDSWIKFKPHSYMVALNVGFNPDVKNSITVSSSQFKRNVVRHSVTTRSHFDENNLLTSKYNRVVEEPESENEKEFSISWNHLFPGEDEELNIEFSSSGDREDENSHNTVYSLFPALPAMRNNTLVKNSEDQQQLTIDYARPFGEDAKWEIGYAGYFMQQDFDFYNEYFDTAQNRFVNDAFQTNRFIYKDVNHGFFSSFEKSFEKFGFKAGLRAENVKLKGRLVTKDSIIDNQYFKLFPTLHFSYKATGGEWQLSYSKRINRPEGDELNPFPEYTDPLNISAGNPKLLPEFIHSFQAGYKWQNKTFSILPSLYYRYKVNGFTTVTIPLNDSVFLTTDQNLTSDESVGLETIFSVKKDVYSINTSINFFYNSIDASELGYSDKKSVLSMNSGLNSTFFISKSTMLQVTANYRSVRLTAQGKQYPSFNFNGGVRQDFFNKKLSISLTASDIFKTQRQKTEINTNYFKQYSFGKRDSPVFYLGISFRFGRTAKQQDEEKFEFDEQL